MAKSQKKLLKGARVPPVDPDGMAVESSDGGFSGPEGPPSPGGMEEPATKKANTSELECYDIATPGTSSTTTCASSPPSSVPAAAPVEPAPPGIFEVMQMLHSMNQDQVAMRLSFERFHDRFEVQERSIAKLDRAIVSAVDGLDTRLETFKREVDARFAKLVISPTPAAAPKTPPGASSSGGASSGGPPASSTTRSSTAGSPLASSPSAVEADRKLIALGFPRTLPRPALLGWWEVVRLQLPLDVQSKATFQGGTGKSFSVVFPCRADARAFTSFISINKILFHWTSPRGEAPFPVSFKAERSVEEKNRGRALAEAWKILSPLINDSAAFDKGQMKFTTDPRRGTIAVATGLDMWDLVQLKFNNDTYSITTDDASFAFFGIAPEVAEAVRTSVATPRASQ